VNASQEYKLKSMYDIYKTVEEIREDMCKTELGYDEWIRMTPHQLMGLVMRKTSGRHNPEIVLRCVRL
jgi:Asp-tRNA(Asn)/Glu-tRNA(Gln) amidotransferase B subunit